MCGVLFFLSKSGQPVPQSCVSAALSAIRHRGPDDEAYYHFENAALGFARLSIVDEQGGKQPLINEDGSIAVICNGEIYNYKELRSVLTAKGHIFRTESDCEVIAHLYEEDPHDYVNQLDGMFAFVLLDQRRRTVHAARDRVGIKPLMIHESAGYLCLGSEAKALLASGLPGRVFDNQGLEDFFTFNYIPGRRTVFRDISHVPPGHLLQIDLSSSRQTLREYWSPSFPAAQNKWAFAGPWGRRLRDTLQGAVSAHTIGDRPVASYLSGGIDSTVIAVLLQKLLAGTGNLTTFSIAFPGFECDESSVFQETIKRYAFNAREVAIKEINTELFQQALWHIEQPQSSTLDIPMQQLSGLVRREGVKVVLSGEGSDELLGGYAVYTLNQLRRALSLPAIEGFRPILLPPTLKYFIRHKEDIDFYERLYGGDLTPVISRFGTFPAWYPNWLRRREISHGLLRDPGSDSLGEGSALEEICAPLRTKYAAIDDFNKSLYLELKLRLPNYILHRADRNSMAHSVEQRVPFLSNRMIEFTGTIPPLLKMFGFREKYILRKAFRSVIPKAVLKRMKYGYTSPSELLWGRPDTRRDEMMSARGLEHTKIFNTARVIDLVREHSETKSEWRKPVLQDVLTGILSIQLLADSYGVTN